MRKVLDDTLVGLREEESELGRVQARIDALLRIKEGVESYLGIDRGVSAVDGVGGVGGVDRVVPQVVVSPSVARVGPRGREAAAAILRERPKQPMTSQQIADEVVARGWIDPGSSALDAVRTALLRAMKAFDEIQRVGVGTYEWVPRDFESRETDLNDASEPSSLPVDVVTGPDQHLTAEARYHYAEEVAAFE